MRWRRLAMKRVRSRVIIVNDSGSLGGGILLGLAKLGIGLGFGRTFFVLLEEGGTYSTGF